MLGTSRNSLEAARAALVARADLSGFDGLADELLAAAGVLGGSTSLRGSLSDAGTPADERRSLARTVFGGRVSETTVEVLGDAVGRRWSAPMDFVDAVEALGVEAALAAAERAGRLDAIEDELFRVARIVSGDAALRDALSDLAVPAEQRADLAGGLLSGKVSEETERLVRHVVTHPRGRRLEEALDELVEASARRREHLFATVTVAAPVTEEQQQRLAAALTRVYRREVTVQVEVDPALVGGAVVRVGDEVIDGSVAHRLDEARRNMGG